MTFSGGSGRAPLGEYFGETRKALTDKLDGLQAHLTRQGIGTAYPCRHPRGAAEDLEGPEGGDGPPPGDARGQEPIAGIEDTAVGARATGGLHRASGRQSSAPTGRCRLFYGQPSVGCLTSPHHRSQAKRREEAPTIAEQVSTPYGVRGAHEASRCTGSTRPGPALVERDEDFSIPSQASRAKTRRPPGLMTPAERADAPRRQPAYGRYRPAVNFFGVC